MEPAAVKKVVIASVLTEADSVIGRIMHDVAGHGFSESACFGIKLALDEALSNAIRHGNRNDANKHVTVEYRITNDEVRVLVADEGCGFRPDALPDPTCEENIERPNGRGVMLMRAYMSEVHYNPCGNQVTLVKRRNCCMPRKSNGS